MKILLRPDGYELTAEDKYERLYLKQVLERVIFVYEDSEVTIWQQGIKLTGKGSK